MIEYLPALAGGILIGLSACLLMLTYGRIAGISRMMQHVISRAPKESINSLAFLSGTALGAALLMHFTGTKALPPETNPILIIVSGLLVGYGTSLGSGCTSGHGICGLSRLSIRSLIATLCFMASGIATVYVVRHVI